MVPAISGYKINEIIHESNHSLVYRAQRTPDNLPVVLKMMKQAYPSSEKIARFKREYDLLTGLNISGIIGAHKLETYHRRLVMVLEDFGGEDLTRLMQIRPFTLDAFLPLAIQIVDILTQVHQQQIMHKDINPTNIVMNPATRQTKLIDFGISTVLSRENTTLRNPNVLEGTLAYISPEQTGRMNRAIDYRTDFYSLGVTFYELLTGHLPFPTQDAMELVHAHIAKPPPPPHHLNPDIPRPLSNIVLKLMNKSPEERYQSAHGLKLDLEECWHRWQSTGTINPFTLGQQDISSRFQIPQKLYGREQELDLLMTTFGRVSQADENENASPPSDDTPSQSGQPAPHIELMLVSGYAGIGKSALVQELYKPITHRRGYFVTGKFDHLQRSIPYAPLAQALGALTRQILAEGHAQIEAWRSKLLAALGPNGQVIIDVIPEVALVVGPQPPVPQLGPKESQNRFNLVFQNFIQVFAQPDHPLVLFLDDLQWADNASLNLLKFLMTSPNTRHLLIIGAYRDNEVDSAHPLMVIASEIEQSGGIVNQISLPPLKPAIVNQLISDTLYCNPETTEPLARLVWQKTHGNPFFINEFLKTLYTEALLTFDFETNQWQWSLAEIQAKNMTANVVELMVDKVQKLAPNTQQVLKLAACIGSQFDLQTLAVVYKKTAQKTAAALWGAMTEDLILPLDDTYKLMEQDVQGLSEQVKVTYKFAHDRIQQAAYSLIPAAEKQAVHWQVGQRLLKNTPVQEREQKIFDLVNQLNLGLPLIDSQAERDELIELNLIAGKKAKSSAAFQAAFNYLQTGLTLLGGAGQSSTGWQTDYNRALTLHVEAAEAACLSGHFEQMKQLITTILAQANTPLDKVKAYEINFQAYFAQNNLASVIETGRKVMEMLGVTLPATPSQTDALHILEEIKKSLAGKRIAELIDSPPMTDPYHLAKMRVLANMAAASYGGYPELYLLFTSSTVRLAVKHGNAPTTARSYAAYGIVLSGAMNEIEMGYEFGQLAVNLMEKLGAAEIKPVILYLFNGLIVHWQKHIDQTLEPLLQGYQSGLETGHLYFTALCAYQYLQHNYWIGQELLELSQKMEKYNQNIARLRQQRVLNPSQMYHQTVLNLQGKNSNPCLLAGSAYNEEEMLPHHRAAGDSFGLATLYINKLVLNYLFGNYQQALENADLAQKHLSGALGQVASVIYYLYDSLTRLALYDQLDPAAKETTLQRVNSNCQKLKQWAHHAPMNYQNKYFLIEAELARVLDKGSEARDYYDQAIALAHEHRYLNEEALAHELTARFHLAKNRPHVARHYLRDAHYAYLQWGATAKAKNLETNYLQFLGQEATPLQTTLTASTTSTNEAIGTLDLISVLKSSQTISGEIVLDRLLANLMKIVIENGGAQKGYFILEKQGQWVIEAEGSIDQTEITVLQSTPITRRATPSETEKPTPQLPLSIINYVAHTHDNVVLSDATQSIQFATDPYIAAQQPQSALCVPLINQGKLTGIVYLENNLTTGAFTADRLELLKLLSAQIAISIENASLYTSLEQSEKKYRALFEDSRDAIYIITREGKFLDINPAALKMFGYTRAEMLQLNAKDLYLNPDDRLKFQQAIEQTGSVRDYELMFQRKDGSIIHCLSTSTLRQADDGTILGYQGVIRDITERKKAERERAKLISIQGELDVARKMQSSLLPSASPNWPSLDVVCYSTPAREVGGDFYTYHTVTGPSQPDNFAVAIGDVSGKGMPAALLMSVSLASLEAVINQGHPPAQLLTYLDPVIRRYTKTTRQNCALCYTRIETTPNHKGQKLISVANAGCVLPLVRYAAGQTEWVDAIGLPLGTPLGAEFNYPELHLNLSENDLLILTSDGVIEANNPAGHFFGFDRLKQAVATGPVTSAQAMLTHLQSQLAAFTQEAEQHDDITIVVIRL